MRTLPSPYGYLRVHAGLISSGNMLANGGIVIWNVNDAQCKQLCIIGFLHPDGKLQELHSHNQMAVELIVTVDEHKNLR